MEKERLKEKPFYLSDLDITWVEKTIEHMSLEEKVGQLFCISPNIEDEKSLAELMNIKPGGVMLRPFDTAKVVEGVKKLNSLSEIPLLLAADLEKGGNGVSNQGTAIGSPLGIAATNKKEYAEKLGRICAEEGKAVGLNWAFGPIVDIDKNPFNPILNVRTFGSNQERVKEMGLAYIHAVEGAGMATSSKHFPGDGVDFRDQHICGSTNALSCEEWDLTYGEIYRACIDAGTRSIMVGHIYQPAWTRYFNPDIKNEDILPASMSSELIQGLLRTHLKYNGLVLTDATTMTGFMQALPRPQLIPQVIASGVDMILFSLNLKADVQYLLDAIADGRLSMERVDEALMRILALKASLGIHKQVKEPQLEEAERVVGSEEHKQWAKEMADQSITLVKEEKGVLPLTPEKYKRMLFIPLEGKPDEFAHNRTRSGASAILGELMKKEGFDVTVLEKGTEVFQNIRIVEYLKEHFDVILYCANFGTTSNQTVVRIQWPGNNMGWVPNFVHTIPTVFVSIENPYHLIDVPRVKTFINAYSPTDITIQAVADKLVGRSSFKGISPVDPFCKLWEAHL